MPGKIIETIIEPSKVVVGSIFKIKIKAIRYTTYKELKEKQKTYSNIKSYTYKDLKGA